MKTFNNETFPNYITCVHCTCVHVHVCGYADYGAPLSEAGDTTEKYFALRSLIQEMLPEQGENGMISTLQCTVHVL